MLHSHVSHLSSTGGNGSNSLDRSNPWIRVTVQTLPLIHVIMFETSVDILDRQTQVNNHITLLLGKKGRAWEFMLQWAIMSLVTCFSTWFCTSKHSELTKREAIHIFWSQDSDAMSILDYEQSGSCSVWTLGTLPFSLSPLFKWSVGLCRTDLKQPTDTH